MNESNVWLRYDVALFRLERNLMGRSIPEKAHV